MFKEAPSLFVAGNNPTIPNPKFPRDLPLWEKTPKQPKSRISNTNLNYLNCTKPCPFKNFRRCKIGFFFLVKSNDQQWSIKLY